MSKTYEIKTIADFMAVPVDRIDECLAELRVAIALSHEMARLANMTATLKKFSWIDDGKSDYSITAKLPDGQTVTASGEYAKNKTT